MGKYFCDMMLWNWIQMNYIYAISEYENEYENEIYVHSHLVLNTVLGKWNEMENQMGEQLLKPLNSTKLLTTNNTDTTNY